MKITDVPPSFRRLVASRTGRSFRDVARIIDKPMLYPSADEVLIKVAYAGVNGGCETFRCRGEHAFSCNIQRADFPLGAESVGTIVATSTSDTRALKLKVGSAVAVNGGGGFSEYILATRSQCTALAAERPTAEHCALSLSGVTALVALTTGKLKAGERVVVNAAAGGTGHLAVQIALELGASLVVAICGGKEKAEAVKSLYRGDGQGRLEVIDYKVNDPTMDEELTRISPLGFDIIWDGVGGDMRVTLLNHLAPEGRLLQVGYISSYPHTRSYGEILEVSEEADIFWGGKNILLPGGRRIIGKIWPDDPLSIARARKRIFKLHKDGLIKALIDSSAFRGIASIPEAVEHMLNGQHIGKVVVEL